MKEHVQRHNLRNISPPTLKTIVKTLQSSAAPLPKNEEEIVKLCQQSIGFCRLLLKEYRARLTHTKSSKAEVAVRGSRLFRTAQEPSIDREPYGDTIFNSYP